MSPESKRERHRFCSSPVPMRLLGGSMASRKDPSLSDPVAVYNTAAIVAMTAGRSLPS